MQELLCFCAEDAGHPFGQAPADRSAHLAWQALFSAQMPYVQEFFARQAQILAAALAGRWPQVRFNLPERILIFGARPGESQFFTLPVGSRRQRVGSFWGRLGGRNLLPPLLKRLAELEASPHPGLANSAVLLRHATAWHLLQELIPAGQAVSYRAAGGETIPTIPCTALPQVGDETGLQFSAYPPAARRFYLPPWVAFDDAGALLAPSLEVAQAQVEALQHFVTLLDLAAALAPAILASESYRQKCYGLLGQLVNQGRALARGQTCRLIETIRRRAAAGTLNRGLSLSVPYFDDRALSLRTHDFEVIPTGRVLFVPAFVVCAVRTEEERVMQNPQLTRSTRNHLLAELRTIERAFETPGQSPRSGLRKRLRESAVQPVGVGPEPLPETGLLRSKRA